MGYDRWRAGELVTASKLNSMIPQYILQAVDLTRASSVTLTATDIVFTPDVSATYYYEMYIGYSASQTADIRWAWSAAQATFKRFVLMQLPQSSDGVDIGNNLVSRQPLQASPAIAGGGDVAGTTDPVAFMSAWDRGTFTTTATPATVTLQVGQGTSTAQKTIFRGANSSRLLYQRIA